MVRLWVGGTTGLGALAGPRRHSQEQVPAALEAQPVFAVGMGLAVVVVAAASVAEALAAAAAFLAAQHLRIGLAVGLQFCDTAGLAAALPEQQLLAQAAAVLRLAALLHGDPTAIGSAVWHRIAAMQTKLFVRARIMTLSVSTKTPSRSIGCLYPLGG